MNSLLLGLFDEQSLKSACKAITNSSSNAIKSEYVRTFTEAIGNQVIDSTHWEKIFDGQGANSALKQKIYTSQMIKLLVIRALAIPSTLPHYLSWRAGAGKKNNNVDTIAQEFELELKRKLKEINNQSQELPPAILSNIVEGFGTVLSKFLNDERVSKKYNQQPERPLNLPILRDFLFRFLHNWGLGGLFETFQTPSDSVSLEAIASLLKDRQGLWGSQSRQFIDSLDRDLHKMHGFANPEQQNQQRSQQGSIYENTRINTQLYGNSNSSASVPNSIQFELNDESWQKIWRDLVPFWGSFCRPNKKYTKFAELFENVGETKIALIFYHISEGTLSPQRFRRLTNSNKFGVKVYGVIVRREKSFSKEASDSIQQVINYLFFEDPSKNNSGRQDMRRYLTIVIVGLSFIGGIAFRSIFKSDQSQTSSEAISSSSTVVDTKTTQASQVDYKQEEQIRTRLIKNIENIYGLKKALELEKNPGKPINYNVSEEILKEFKITTATGLDKLSLILNQISKSQNPNKQITVKLNSWGPAEIANTIKPIDDYLKVKNKALDPVETGVLKTIKGKITKEWKNPEGMENKTVPKTSTSP